VCSADVLSATQNLSKPYWPQLASDAKSITNLNITKLQGVNHIGEGFLDIGDFVLSDDALGVLQALAAHTAAVESYTCGREATSDLATLIDQRNSIQYRLLCLPTAGELNTELVNSPSVYESVRLTALIYSVAVTFPLPLSTSPILKLVFRLKLILAKTSAERNCKRVHGVLFWCLMIGGIAASNTEDRSWYVENLVILSAKLGFFTWRDVVSEMGRYLWLESACDSGGRDLWMEVLHFRSFGQNIAHLF
jgi:hypothetical protein